MSAKTFQEALAQARPNFFIKNYDEDKRQVFGWASVAVRVGGEVVVDYQEDIIEIDELEQAAYAYTANFGTAGEMHKRGNVGHLIESLVFTKEKSAALGIPPDVLPEGWWVGYHINDDEVWEKIKNGTYTMFSIEGSAQRVEVEE